MGLSCKLIIHFNSIFFVGLFCFQTAICNSQTCLPNGIQFTTQEDIDNFAINHPGCTDIIGDVTIGEVSGIDNLKSLSQVERI